MRNYEQAEQRFDHFASGDGSNRPGSADEAVRALGEMVECLRQEVAALRNDADDGGSGDAYKEAAARIRQTWEACGYGQ
jgi:hypothetical protein